MTAAPPRTPSAPLERVLGALPTARTVGRGWEARCPAHDDRKASLSIAEGDDGKVLLDCKATCATQAVLDALGLTWGDLFPPATARRNGHAPRAPKRREIARYDYRAADGRLDFQVVRFEPKDFRQRRPDPTSPDGWDWHAGDKNLLYRLPELLAAGREAWVFKGEGEKDCNGLAAIGLVATTNAGGAGKWRPAHAEHLRGRRVAILPDNDAAGRTDAVQVAAGLEGIAADVRIVELPDLPPKGDVSDWLAAGGTAAALLALVEATPRWRATPDADDDCDCLKCATTIARLRAEVAELRRHQTLTLDALANPDLPLVQKAAAVVLAFQVHSAASRGQPAQKVSRKMVGERIGVGEEAAGRAVKPFIGSLFAMQKVPRTAELVDRETGEVRTMRLRGYVPAYSALHADLGAGLRAIRDHAPASPKRHGGPRDCAHPDVIEGRITRCTACRAVLADTTAPAGKTPHLGVSYPEDHSPPTSGDTPVPHLGVSFPAPAQPDPAAEREGWAKLNATLEPQRSRPAPKTPQDGVPSVPPPPNGHTPERPDWLEGRCDTHHRLLGDREWAARACSWCQPPPAAATGGPAPPDHGALFAAELG